MEKQLRETREKLKSASKDVRFTESLIDKLLQTKAEMGVEPTLLFVPMSYVEKEYDFNSFKLIRTKNEIIYSSNGYRLVIKPWVKTLYGQLDFLLRYKDKYDNLTEEEKKTYDDIFNCSIIILQIPLLAFSDDSFSFELGTMYLKHINELAEKSTATLKEEDEEKNEEFRQAETLAEEVSKSVEKEK